MERLILLSFKANERRRLLSLAILLIELHEYNMFPIKMSWCIKVSVYRFRALTLWQVMTVYTLPSCVQKEIGKWEMNGCRNDFGACFRSEWVRREVHDVNSFQVSGASLQSVKKLCHRNCHNWNAIDSMLTFSWLCYRMSDAYGKNCTRNSGLTFTWLCYRMSDAYRKNCTCWMKWKASPKFMLEVSAYSFDCNVTISWELMAGFMVIIGPCQA